MIPKGGLQKLNNLICIREGRGLWGGVPGWGDRGLQVQVCMKNKRGCNVIIHSFQACHPQLEMQGSMPQELAGPEVKPGYAELIRALHLGTEGRILTISVWQ